MPTKEEEVKKAENLIRYGFAGGLLLVGFAMIGILAPMFRGAETKFYGQTSIANLLDVAIGFLLAKGVLNKSRTCAILLLAYYLFDQVYIFSMGRAGLSNLIWGAIFLWMLISGIVGTFRYHKLLPEINKRPNFTKIFIELSSVAALLAGIFTLSMILTPQEGSQFDFYNLLDVAFFWGFAAGIYFKKSRVCAVLLLAYHIWNRLMFGFDVIGTVFGILYILGVVGTFMYQRAQKTKEPIRGYD